MSQDDINRQAFLEEANELLAELETALLELEDTPEDSELVDRVFRAMHTIKGSGAMFGFDDVAHFTHDVETVFDMVRGGDVPVSKELLDLTLGARDHILELLEDDTGKAAGSPQSKAIIAGLRNLSGMGSGTDSVERPEVAQDDSGDSDSVVTYRVRFKPEQGVFSSGTNPLALIEELTEMGMHQVVAHIENIPPLSELDPEDCHVWWDVVLATDKGEDGIRDVFIFVEDDCELMIQTIDKLGALENDTSYKRLGEILVERGDLTQDDLKGVLGEQKRLGDLLTEAGVVSEEQIQSALAEQHAVQSMRKVKKEQTTASSIRVAADKLDYLVDLVGELVIVQAQITQVAGEKSDQEFIELAEELERLTDELRDSTLSVRMLPIGSTFSKFRRLVRDLSDELGKKIELTTSGAETELDKTVIERLNDPLVHLLRNSIDHGIEPPEIRDAAGKPTAGTIFLSAEHAGGEVLITIKDDGAGMDSNTILAKGVERGLVPKDADLSDKDIFNLIFAPGFSTANKVTSVSGRGVGMDVVKRGIDALRGSIDVDSKRGEGTVITVRLPLTLAIIDGLQIKVEDEHYVIPLSLVEECVELMQTEEERAREQQVLNLRGDIVPYIRLRDWFTVPGIAPEIEQVVVTGFDGSRIGIVVDNVIGEHQTVIKSLGRVYRDVDGISGATIKGDGSMALILDVPQIIRTASASRI
ncbi:chemotaxis protein CheA [Desulfovibrio ferrophilus]|uniref:Chemotaxis protein CheA n=1 Tax=Desulfovibrio ferrophilus TaxID=241368 RepID=A0A2Z6AW91_9BACT|nr:chemotaxis protein CheA [Desulfovibrio ferrophilus]BBD07498.1 CheA signal transduction histidine kinase [Desulfovibrio ferrophilus]